MAAQPPTNNCVKIRYGLILQGVLARALYQLKVIA